MNVQVTGKCGSVSVRLIPAPRGAGIVAARTPKKVLQMAGIEDCYTSATGSTKTLGNFVKVGRHLHILSSQECNASLDCMDRDCAPVMAWTVLCKGR